MKIYTKTGDDGTTSLFSGGRVVKTHLRVEAYGTVDELSAVIGVARTHQPSPETETWLTEIQNQLFYLGADLATPADSANQKVVRMDAKAIEWLEVKIDHMSEGLPELKAFILPGGSPVSAQLHVARTVCRRAERNAIKLGQAESIGDFVVQYLNRLSDFFFMLARWENHQAGISDEEWLAP
jgi:cob(I)alamin adenosyltransferase